MSLSVEFLLEFDLMFLILVERVWIVQYICVFSWLLEHVAQMCCWGDGTCVLHLTIEIETCGDSSWTHDS